MNNLDKYLNVKSSLSATENFVDSVEFLDILFSNPMNWNEDSFKNKLDLFCPYFLNLIETKLNPRIAEYYSGIGVFLKLMKKINSSCEVHFVNDSESNSVKIATSILNGEEYKINDSLSEEKYDVILSDGVFNWLLDSEIKDLTLKIKESLRVNGIFLLLVNLEPTMLRKDFDLQAIHNDLQNDLICVWGKNTFSSIWMKK